MVTTVLSISVMALCALKASAFHLSTKVNFLQCRNARYPGPVVHAQASQPSAYVGKRNTHLMAETSSSDSSSEVEFTEEEQAMVEELYRKAQQCNDDEIPAFFQESLSTMLANLIVKLRQSGNTHSIPAVQYVASRINKTLENQLDDAKQTLEELLDAGEIRKLDHLIGQASRSGKLNVPFFNVLNVNLKDAMAAAASTDNDGTDDNDEKEGSSSGAASRLQILQHIYTRCQEEMEKGIPPGLALLNKLLRQPQESIRKNLYEHYLTPQTSTKIVTPDGKEVELKGQGTATALVTLPDFISAIAKTVQQIRVVEQAGATDRASAAAMVENCRQVAKEARVIIGEHYGVESAELQTLEEGLQPVFRPTSPESPYITGQEQPQTPQA